MCVICIKEKGVKISEEKIKDMWEANDDGCGIAWHTGRGINILRNYSIRFEDFKKWFEMADKQWNLTDTSKTVVFHFRIGTSGEPGLNSVHPFVLTDKPEKYYKRKRIMNTNFDVLFHNGILNSYVTTEMALYQDLSDTQVFAMMVVHKLLKQTNNLEQTADILHRMIDSGNKLCMIDHETGVVYRTGDWKKDGELVVSNKSYEFKYNYKWRGGWSESSAGYTGPYNYNNYERFCENCGDNIDDNNSILTSDGFCVCEDCYDDVCDDAHNSMIECTYCGIYYDKYDICEVQESGGNIVKLCKDCAEYLKAVRNICV